MCNFLIAPLSLIICKSFLPSHNLFHFSWRSALLSSASYQRDLCNKLARGPTTSNHSSNLSFVPIALIPTSRTTNTSAWCVSLPLFDHRYSLPCEPALLPFLSGSLRTNSIPRGWMLLPFSMLSLCLKHLILSDTAPAFLQSDTLAGLHSHCLALPPSVICLPCVYHYQSKIRGTHFLSDHEENASVDNILKT